MISKIKNIYIKYKEIINYLIFGVATTIVNFTTYYLFKFIGIDKTISNAIAWVFAVVFAYITNKIYVFNSKAKQKEDVIKEFISFFSFRGLSGIIDIGLFFLLVQIMNMNDSIVKISIQILVVALNYVFSKLFIFKKKKTD